MTTRFRRVVVAAAALAWLALPAALHALTVDMDPAPRIPLRPGQSQHFLVHLSAAAADCRGTVSFKGLAEGLSAEPAEQPFTLAPGATRLLVFKLTNSQWGEEATVRPTVTVDGKEPVRFPPELATTIVRDRKMLDKAALDDKGLLFYYSCGDGEPYRADRLIADRAAGRDKMWDEGMWESPGGVKGKCIRGANGAMKSKASFDPLNNVDHRRGTILCWIRKEAKLTEISYWGAADRTAYDATWRFGPSAGAGGSGEGIFGGNWTPQKVARRRVKGWKEKPGSDSFIGLRRYKALGEKPGYLEAVYLALRQRRYSVRAPFEWTDRWQHVAVLWDIEQRRLEIYIDGKRRNDTLLVDGKPAGDEPWYGAPWSVALPDNAAFAVIKHPDEGGRSVTRRDEFYIYSRALSADEIRANMRASMSRVVAPIIEPAGASFHDTCTVTVRSHWGGVTNRYTLDGSEPDAESPLYAGPISLDKGAEFRVRSFMAGFAPSEVTSASFKGLGPDRRKPMVKRVLALNDPGVVRVIFDKDVQPSSAGAAANYSLDGGAKVLSAELGRFKRTVTLKLSAPLTPGPHKLSVKAVADTTPSANVMEQAEQPFEMHHLPGLAAWWTFDVLDGPFLKDLGPAGADGTAYTDVNIRRANRVPGHVGRALYLRDPRDFADLTRYVDEPDSTNLDDKTVDTSWPLSTDEGTVALWLKAGPKERGSRLILVKKYAYSISIYRNSLMFGGEGWRSKAGDPALAVADNEWHHVALVFKNKTGNGAKLYLDGAFKAAVTPRFLNHKRTRMQLCSPVGWGGGLVNLDGAIDEVMFFTRQLGEAEVSRLARTGYLSPPAAGASAP